MIIRPKTKILTDGLTSRKRKGAGRDLRWIDARINRKRTLQILAVTLVTLVVLHSASAQVSDNEAAVAAFTRGQDLHEKGDLKAAVAQYEIGRAHV